MQCLESEKEMAFMWNTKPEWKHFHIKHSERHFTGALAAQASQSCISLFPVTMALGRALKAQGVTAATRLMWGHMGCSVPSPCPQDGSWDPAAPTPRQCRGSKSCRLSLGTQ